MSAARAAPLRVVRGASLVVELPSTDPRVRSALRSVAAGLGLPAGTPIHRKVGGKVWLPRELALPAVRLDVTKIERARPARRAMKARHTLRDYQTPAVAVFDGGASGVLEAPCGSGKTTCAIEIIARANTPSLVLVHTKDLQAQWVERVKRDLPGAKTSTSPDQLALVDVAVLMIQTLANMTPGELRKLGAGFGLVVLDEAHHAPAATFTRVIGSLPCAQRVGLTATPERADGLHPLLFAHFGAVRHRIATTTLQAAGATLAPVVRVKQTRSTTPDDDAARDTLLRRQVRELAAAGRQVLVLVRRVEHARDLARALGKWFPSAVLVGDVAPTDRAAVLAAVRAGRVRVLVATSLADEGLDLPSVDAIVLGSPSGSLARVQQRIGRALRPRPGKAQPIVIDLVDDGTAYRAAAAERRAMYRDLGWTVEGK